MGKKRVRSQGMRRQVRQVRPKVQQPSVAPADQRKQQQRYLAAGGMFQGYDPELVLRIGYMGIGVVVACLLIILELLVGPVRPFDWAVRIVAAVAWLIPIAILVSFLGPGVRLAWRDRKQEAKLVQGQLIGASSVSTQIGLGMIMVKTRGGQEQFLCAPEKLAKVPGNQINVALTVTPGLRHVRSVSVIGQRLMPRAEPPVPPVIKRMHMLAIIVPAALALAVILGDDIVAFLPIPNAILHVGLALLGAAALGGGTYLASTLFQRRIMAEFQALLPS